MSFLILFFAFLLDHTLGELRRWHPLVGLGNLILTVERRLYRPTRGAGVLAVVVLALPMMLLGIWVETLRDSLPTLYGMIAVAVVYVAVGWRSLKQHARRVAGPLRRGELDLARQRLALIVSRDTDALTPSEVSAATTESVLENGSDAIFAVVFWFMVAGVPGVLLYRLVNTLDAMWGYRTRRYVAFGWAAARLDDVLNFIPARLVVVSYGIATRSWWRFRQSMACAFQQGRGWKSPNAGPVMAAGAGALNVVLGGDMPYHGRVQSRPVLGVGDAPSAGTIEAACRLVNRTVIVWMLVVAALGAVGVGL